MIDEYGYWRLSDDDTEVHTKCIGCIWVAKRERFEHLSKCSRGFAPRMVWAGMYGKCKMRTFDFKLAMLHKVDEDYRFKKVY